MNDDDWNIYRGISKEVESDEENCELKLNEIDVELREIDPGKQILTYLINYIIYLKIFLKK
jgi:hypothetical protein